MGYSNKILSLKIAATGPVVDRMNMVRKEMNSHGYDFGIRTSYKGATFNNISYIPFDYRTLNFIKEFERPPSKRNKFIQYKKDED